MRKGHFLAALLLAAVLSAVFFPILFQGKTFLPVDEYHMLYKPFSAEHAQFNPFNHFEDDILKWYYEWKFYARKHLYRPYWSPNAFGGIPWYANTYASHFGSSNWILALGPLNKTYPLQLIFQLWLAGFGMFLFLQSLRLRFGVAFLFSVAFMLSSIFITLLLRWWILGAFSWVPYLFWAARIFWDSGKSRYFALSSLFLALSFMDGFLQTDAFVLFTFGVFSLGWWFWMNKGRGFFKFSTQFAGILLLAFLLSAVMWLPTMEYFLQDLSKGSSRAAGNVFGKSILQRFLSLPLLASFFMPQLLGSVRALDLAKLINTHLQDFAAFVGSAPLFFGICGVFNYRHWENRMKPFLWIALLGLFIPIFTPFDRYFYFRFLIVYVTGICIVGALAMNRFLEKGQEKTADLKSEKYFFSFWALLLAGVLALNLAILFCGQFLHEKLHAYIAAHIDFGTIGARNHDWMLSRVDKTFAHFSIFSPTMWVPFLLAGGIFLLLRLYRKKMLSSSYFLSAVTLVTILELGFFAKSWLPVNDEKNYPLYPKNYVADFLVEKALGYRSTVNDFNGSEIQKQHQIIPANSQVIYGYHSLEGFDGLVPPVVFYIPAELNDPFRLGLLNVKYVLTNPIPRLRNPAFTLVKDGVVAIYENKLVKSRGRILFNYRVISNDKVQKFMASQEYDGNSALFPEEPALKIQSGAPAQENTEIVSESDNQITYRFKNAKDGYFVASETYYPGWKAKLDGKGVDILRANYAMRAVVAPAGEHLLEFSFEPEIYKKGLLLSALGLLLFLALVAAPWKNRSRAQEAS